MYTHPTRKGILLVCLWIMAGILPIEATYAQSTNLEVYQQLTADCLEPFSDTLSTLVLNSPPDRSYLHEKVLQTWISDGKRIVLNDTSQGLSNPGTGYSLAYRVDRQDVDYQYRNRRSLKRQIRLEIQMRILSSNQVVLASEHCSRAFSDTLPQSKISDMEHAAYPETRAPLPTAGWVKRFLEPGVLISASALGVYLFFNLRSSSNSDA